MEKTRILTTSDEAGLGFGYSQEKLLSFAGDRRICSMGERFHYRTKVVPRKSKEKGELADLATPPNSQEFGAFC